LAQRLLNLGEPLQPLRERQGLRTPRPARHPPTGFVPASPAFRSQRTNRNRRNRRGATLNKRCGYSRHVASPKSSAPMACRCASLRMTLRACQARTLLRSRRTSRSTGTHPCRSPVANVLRGRRERHGATPHAVSFWHARSRWCRGAQLVLHPTPFRSRRTNRSRENQRGAIPNDRWSGVPPRLRRQKSSSAKSWAAKFRDHRKRGDDLVLHRGW